MACGVFPEVSKTGGYEGVIYENSNKDKELTVTIQVRNDSHIRATLRLRRGKENPGIGSVKAGATQAISHIVPPGWAIELKVEGSKEQQCHYTIGVG
ncbi:MAG: hypothetical protein E3J71_09350 [Candidatus Stahlbacteria bacterium]|nr:MAG: hypothetical protein E3J71_09350 [Candidatus Stahlbacteria bacterium]